MNEQEVKNMCIAFGAGIGILYARATPDERAVIRKEYNGENLKNMFDGIDQQLQEMQQQQGQLQ